MSAKPQNPVSDVNWGACKENGDASLDKKHNSFWEQYKELIYKFGHYYATVCGLVMINYIPARPTNTWSHKAVIAYSNFLSFCIIVLLPVYFGYNFETLLATAEDRHSGKLQVLVNFTNTLLKWLTVIVSYLANLIYYSEIRNITNMRQRLEDIFGVRWGAPRKRFERMLLFKFGIINVMLLTYWCHLGYEICLDGVLSVRGHFEVYRFMLWNYTENMADYFYFINSSALKFYRQLKENVTDIFSLISSLESHYNSKKRGLFIEHCGKLSERLDVLTGRYLEIHALSQTSIRIQQFQILGLVLMTLISNLTNFFTLYDLLMRTAATSYNDASSSGNNSSITSTVRPDIINGNHTINATMTASGDARAIPQLIFSIVYTLFFYIDTYIVALISHEIHEELCKLSDLLRRFNEFLYLDVRLEQSIESFALLVRSCKAEFRICGLFILDRRLTYLTACTGLSYFITLVQFNEGLNAKQNSS